MAIPDHIQLRTDTSANWNTANPTLMYGEMGLETDTGRFKIGDEATAWNSLTHFPELGVNYLKSYTLSTVPDAALNQRGMLFVMDETGGSVPAYSDGTNWCRFSDGATIS